MIYKGSYWNIVKSIIALKWDTSYSYSHLVWIPIWWWNSHTMELEKLVFLFEIMKFHNPNLQIIVSSTNDSLCLSWPLALLLLRSNWWINPCVQVIILIFPIQREIVLEYPHPIYKMEMTGWANEDLYGGIVHVWLLMARVVSIDKVGIISK